MDDEGPAPGVGHLVDEPVETFLGILIVDADAAFHRDGERRGFAHRRHAFRDEVRLRHQAGAEPPRLHAVGGTADIEIDLVIAVLGADARGLGELAGSLPPS